MLIVGLTSFPGQAEDSVTLRQDRLFINQLLRRHFFDLARYHCVQQQAASTSTDSKANWQLRLSEIYEQQAWFSATPNRNGLLNHAAEQITDFLEADRPSPEAEFLLRIQQIRLLSNAVRMELVVAEGGHLFGLSVRKTANVVTDHSDHKSRISTLNQSLDLVDALLKQLDQLRRDLDPQMVRRIRETARLERAEIFVLRYRLQQQATGASKEEFEVAAKAANEASRPSDPSVKARGRLLSAELALASSDRPTFLLRIRSIEPADAPMGFHPQFLLARSMLAHQEATEALRELESISVRTTLQQQQLEWLKLECRLGIRELAGELQNSQFVAESSNEFQQQLATSGKLLKGVFRDAAERTAQRFNLVNVVGVEVADLVEQVEIQRALKQPQMALRLIEQALLQLPPDSRQAIAALKLRAGEIHVADRKWSLASEKLTDAVKLFGQLDMSKQQAAADLLQIYVLSQQLNDLQPDAQQKYIASLEKHIVDFPDESSSVVAMRWLFDILQSSDSIRAADLALQLFRKETKPRQKTAALERLGNLLLQAEASAESKSLVAEFDSEFTKLSADEGLYPAVDLVVLRQQVLEFQFADSVANEDDLAKYGDSLMQLRKDLKVASHLPVESVVEIQRRCDLLDVLLTARSIRSTQQIKSVEDRISKTPDDRLLDTIRFLYRHHQHNSVQVGDVWLAGMNQILLRKLLSNPQVGDSKATLIALMPIVRSSNALTNDDRLLTDWIETLLGRQLSGSETAEVAQALAGGASIANSSPALKQFWINIASSNAQGTDLWLESQLRLAELSLLSGKVDAARRRIGVVETLYPNWGSAERKQQAEALAKSKLDR